MIFALVAYAVAMIAANLLVATFGPSVTAINAFFLIGLDLTLRDWLQVRLKTWQMGGLIIGTGLMGAVRIVKIKPINGYFALKAIKKALPDYSAQIDAFLNANKLNLKKEDDMIQLLQQLKALSK